MIRTGLTQWWVKSASRLDIWSAEDNPDATFVAI